MLEIVISLMVGFALSGRSVKTACNKRGVARSDSNSDLCSGLLLLSGSPSSDNLGSFPKTSESLLQTSLVNLGVIFGQPKAALRSAR
jgi:hypothetical protein